MRSDDGGLTWTRIALGSDATNPDCTFQISNGTVHGCFVTSVVLSPLPGEPDTLYVSAHGGDPADCIGSGVCGGVFRISNAACAGDGCADPTTVRIDGTPEPTNAEELTFVNRTLVCACGTEGFFEKSPADPMLVQRNQGLAFDLAEGTSYPAIAGRPGLLVLGAFNASCETIARRSTCHTLYQSVDLGATWTDLTFDQPAGNIDFTVAGSDVPWWESSQSASMIDGSTFNAASIQLTDAATPTILVAGHSGVWRTTNPDHVHWQPAVQGIGATTVNDLIADPVNPGDAFVGVKDWGTFASASDLDPGTVIDSETPLLEQPRKTAGFALALDQDAGTVPSPVYLAAGIPGPTQPAIDAGGVYLNPDPTSEPWTSLGFATDGSCGTRTTPRVIGVAVARPSASSAPEVYAATDGCGLYRLRDGVWARMGASTDLFTIEDFVFNYAPISVPDGLGDVVYALDRDTGELWRSASSGTGWGSGPIFTIPAAERSYNTGWLVADPNVSGASVVWVSTQGPTGLHELTCSAQCQQPGNWTDTSDLGVPYPGPIAIAPCAQPCSSVVYVAAAAVPGQPAALYKSTPTGAFCDVTAQVPFFAASGPFPVQLSSVTGTSGLPTLSLATVGNGVTVLTDGTGPDCA